MEVERVRMESRLEECEEEIMARNREKMER